MLKALVLCNGECPAGDLFREYAEWADYFIAADGGANLARSFEQLPDIVVGDLDSFEYRDEDAFEIVFNPDQETNDLEKALKIAQKEGLQEVVVLGATGKRLDHTLKNLSVLKQFHDFFKKLVFVDDFGTTRLIPRSFSDSFEEGTLISLFPLSGRVSGITTSGLKYPLKNGTLENGVRDGLSNEVVETKISIKHKEGDLLLFVARQC